MLALGAAHPCFSFQGYPQFLMLLREVMKSSFPAASLRLASRIRNPSLGGRSPFAIRSASQSYGTGWFFSGRQIPGCPHSCSQRGVLQEASGQSVLTDLTQSGRRTASSCYRGPFLHLTHYLAAACR